MIGSTPTVRLAVLLLSFCLADSGNAQITDSQGKIIDVFQVDEAPLIDGQLDDDAWVFGTVIEDLHEIRPDEFTEPSQKSQIYVVYTKDALYLAARFWDPEPDKIGAKVLRQGDFSFGEDSFTVMIDPFNNERSGYAFDLTANGVRNQAVYRNVIGENWSWQGIWHGESQITEEGWTAEVEIPFKTLSFDPRNETWGLNFARYIGRNQEMIGWVSANRTQNPAVSGKVTGLKGLQQGVGLDVVPAIRATESKDFLTGASTNSAEPSLDLFYKITPALTGALTINTDFSGTSVDARQINLTRFGLFFREQRTFFLQDADIFEFGLIGGRDFQSNSTLSRVEQESGRPFFSRRIGLSSSGETVDMNFGGKVTGRVGPLDIGVLAVQQDELGLVEPRDLFVARLAANVLEESSVGMILTHGDPDANLDNVLGGFDFRYLNTRLANGHTIEAGFWYQQSNTEGLSGDDAAFGFTLRAPNSEGFRGSIAYKELQQNFKPALGFVNRVNVRDFSTALGYTWYPQSTSVRTLYSGVDFQRIETIQGELQSQSIMLRPVEISNNTSDSVGLSYWIADEVVDAPFEISEGVIMPAGSYAFEQPCAEVSTGDYRSLSSHVYYCDGDFYDGTQISTGASLSWRPSKHFRLAARYDYNDIELPGGAFVTRLMSLRADVAFSNKWYWENFVQYDNVSYSLGVNSILRWVQRSGREMVLVVNRQYIDFIRQQHFNRVSGDITFKFSYTFRF
jgi:hypothetical protein